MVTLHASTACDDCMTNYIEMLFSVCQKSE